MALEFVIANANQGFLQAASHTREERLDRNLLDASPESKVTKNRLHLDLIPPRDDQQAELARLTGLGATVLPDQPAGVSWIILADPEGNEFCMEG